MILIYILIGILLILLLSVSFLFLCSLFIDPQKEYTHNSPFYRFLLNSASILALKVLRIKVETSGMEKVPQEEHPLFVCNHFSNFDPIITWCVFRNWQIAFISKAENFNVPIFGKFIRKCCFMAIDRKNPRNAITTINHAAKLLREGEVSVGVYPEGTRSKTGELLPFHNGVFKIAQKANKPIVVLSISGTENIAQNLRKAKSSHIYLDVLDVIPAETVTSNRTYVIGDRVREDIENNLKDRKRRSHEKDICAVQSHCR
jgi:1-acyl-sn-glycerol-3-phosphate acyltransferase